MAELVYDLLVVGLGEAFQNLLTGFGHDLLLQNADFSQFLPALPPQTTEFSSLNSPVRPFWKIILLLSMSLLRGDPKLWARLHRWLGSHFVSKLLQDSGAAHSVPWICYPLVYYLTSLSSSKGVLMWGIASAFLPWPSSRLFMCVLIAANQLWWWMGRLPLFSPWHPLYPWTHSCCAKLAYNF